MDSRCPCLCALTWYPTNAYFQPRVRTYSSQMSPPTYQPARLSVVPCRGSATVGVRRIQRHSAAIERYGRISLEKGKGSNVNPSPVRMKRSQKFWEFRASRGVEGHLSRRPS